MPKLSQLAINDEGFVFDPNTGASFQVSSTGLIVLRGLREDQTDAAIAQSLAEQFDVSLAAAEHDVADFRANLKNLGLI